MNPVVWFEIYVDDMDRAVKFYEMVLEKKLEDMPMPENSGDMQMMSFPSNMNNYGAAGALVKMEGVPAGGGGTMVYFPCEDCAVEEARVEAAGGHVVKPKMSIGEYGWCSICVDSEGNMFGLHTK